ncbi:cyclic nucleotide-binding protein [Rhodohalobacter mucosus]|uniref:Cyclic nucleotide-binding protein n=1 Tax=Rhodohalobacter mucosus TaxID=2079485 RepID=A0A316TV43_9BACT|nr:cyclic nucleotide-binding protein [Rhodohalobacter mucosus]
MLNRFYSHPALSNESVERIISAHDKVQVTKGDFILRENQTSQHYYCLESGLMRAFAVNDQGREITTGFFSPGDIAIEVASLFLGTPTRENIHALTDCVCWRISLNTFQELFDTVHGFSEWGRTWMSGALFISKQRSLSMITDSATERYLVLQKEQPEIIRQAPLKYIASYLGVTDTSLSRIRKELGKGNE